MARKHRHEEHENHERWLVSYADFITLLFAFFTSMYAISNLDLQKAGRLVTSMQAAFGTPLFEGGRGALDGKDGGFDKAGSTFVPPVDPDLSDQKAKEAEAEAAAEARPEGGDRGRAGGVGGDLDRLRQEVESALAAEGLAGKVGFHRVGRELWITLSEEIFFDSASATLLESALPSLRVIASALRASRHDIRIEGHTDVLPIRSQRFPSNWELSTARAMALLRYLVDEQGYDPSRLSAAGYGPYRPTAPNDTPDNRARNRRVEVVIVGRVEESPPDVAAGEPGPPAPAPGSPEPAAAGEAPPGDGTPDQP